MAYSDHTWRFSRGHESNFSRFVDLFESFLSTKYIFVYCLNSIAYFVYKVYFCLLFKQYSLFCLQSLFCELFKLCWICQIGIRFFLISRSLILIQTFLYGQAGTEPRDILWDTDMLVVTNRDHHNQMLHHLYYLVQRTQT